jgi:hypothetical protein
LKVTRGNGRCNNTAALITVDKYKIEEIGLKIGLKIVIKTNKESLKVFKK